MKHFLIVDSNGLISAHTFSDTSPGPNWTLVPDAHEDVATGQFFSRLLPNGNIVQTIIPMLPTESWSVWDSPNGKWSDGRTIADLKAQKWQEMKALRAGEEYGGFVWNGMTFDSDAISQSRIQGAVQMATMNPDLSIDWTLADNTVATLSASDIFAVGVALAAHVNAAHSKGRAKRNTINQSAAKAQIELITWSST